MSRWLGELGVVQGHNFALPRYSEWSILPLNFYLSRLRFRHARPAVFLPGNVVLRCY